MKFDAAQAGSNRPWAMIHQDMPHTNNPSQIVRRQGLIAEVASNAPRIQEKKKGSLSMDVVAATTLVA